MVGQNAFAFDFEVADQRRLGFLNTLKRHGIDFNPADEIPAGFDSHTAEIAMDEFLRRKKLPTAIFCQSDEMAFGVMRSIKKKGLRVPEDISLIGYDNHDFSETVGLTTIAQPVQFLGQLAASQVMAKIEKPQSNTSQMKVPVSLVIRDSVKNIN